MTTSSEVSNSTFTPQSAAVAPRPPETAAAQTAPQVTMGDLDGRKVALGLLAVTLAIPIALASWRIFSKAPLPCSPGGAAALVAILLAVAMVLAFPSVIMDTTDAGGGASTMRILCIAIIFTFCAIELHTAWNEGVVPSLQDQGNWVWLVTAALGGKALQKYAEIKQ